MPNWLDDDGRYRWTPPGEPWYNSVEIPHAPVATYMVAKGCTCAQCTYIRRRMAKQESGVLRPGFREYLGRNK